MFWILSLYVSLEDIAVVYLTCHCLHLWTMDLFIAAPRRVRPWSCIWKTFELSSICTWAKGWDLLGKCLEKLGENSSNLWKSTDGRNPVSCFLWIHSSIFWLANGFHMKWCRIHLWSRVAYKTGCLQDDWYPLVLLQPWMRFYLKLGGKVVGYEDYD